MKQGKKHVEREQHRRGKLSLHPLEFEKALKGAMETGPPPERPKGDGDEAQAEEQEASAREEDDA